VGRIYYVSWDAATAVTTSIDIFEFVPADDKPIVIHELHVWQTSDVGDAAEEILGISWRRKYTTSGSGGGTATAVPANASDTAAGFSLECRNTTVANTGTPEVVFLDGWNVRAPYLWAPADPNDRPVCTQKETQIVFRLDAAPADSLTMNAMAIVEELG
jgi:hypothetical protein